MAVSSKHILEQGAALKGLGRASWSALTQRFRKQGGSFQTPGPTLTETFAPRSAALVRDYVRNVGGSPGLYKTTLPAHLFPQWSFGLASQTLEGIPYPLLKVMNGGCRLEIHTPLPQNEPLLVSARLEDIDDNGRRAVLHQRVVTGTQSAPEALVAHMYPIVPLKRDKSKSARKEPVRVPLHAREIGFWRLSSQAGLDFAKLTGDFNPIHWIPSYARMFGFKNTILHGFATMARAIEGLNQGLFSGANPLRVIDVRFTKPLVLPAKVGLYVTSDQELFVGDAPGGPAYLTGTFSTDAPDSAHT